MPYCYEKSFETAEELVDYFLKDDCFKTEHRFQAAGLGKNEYIFRGQSDAEWSLTPSAFRKENKSGKQLINEYALQYPDQLEYLSGEQPIKRKLGVQLVAELQAVNLFMQHADLQGIATPLTYAPLNDSYELIKMALKDSESYDYTKPFPVKDLERATALAQHHKVPTRLLDWTESPLIACFFAAYDASCFANKPPRDGQEISIIYTNVNGLQRDSCNVELIRVPRYENSNILRQMGVFISMKKANSFYIANERWPSLEDYSSFDVDDVGIPWFPEESIQLDRVRLPATEADNLLKLLFDLNITRLSLMPSLDNAAQACHYASRLFAN